MSNEKVITLNSDNFDDQVLKGTGVILVDFWAPWCGPCRMVGPIVDELASEYDGKAAFGKVNVDENESLSMKYQVMSIPTLLLFKNGQLVDKLVGAHPKDAFEDLLEKYI